MKTRGQRPTLSPWRATIIARTTTTRKKGCVHFVIKKPRYAKSTLFVFLSIEDNIYPHYIQSVPRLCESCNRALLVEVPLSWSAFETAVLPSPIFHSQAIDWIHLPLGLLGGFVGGLGFWCSFVLNTSFHLSPNSTQFYLQGICKSKSTISPCHSRVLYSGCSMSNSPPFRIGGPGVSCLENIAVEFSR